MTEPRAFPDLGGADFGAMVRDLSDEPTMTAFNQILDLFEERRSSIGATTDGACIAALAFLSAFGPVVVLAAAMTGLAPAMLAAWIHVAAMVFALAVAITVCLARRPLTQAAEGEIDRTTTSGLARIASQPEFFPEPIGRARLTTLRKLLARIEQPPLVLLDMLRFESDTLFTPGQNDSAASP